MPRLHLPTFRLLTHATAIVALFAATACSSGGGGESDTQGSGGSNGPALTGYSDLDQVYILGQSITPNVPIFTGDVDSWSVMPGLPAGLALDTNTGVISGRPLEATTDWIKYRVRASGPEGDSQYSLVFWVFDPIEIELISRAPNGDPANEDCFINDLSGDGEHVAYATRADNLVGQLDTNNILVWSGGSQQTTLLTVPLTGGQANNNSGSCRLTPDGSKAVFLSLATNISASSPATPRNSVYVWEEGVGVSWIVELGGEFGGTQRGPDISDDGNVIVYGQRCGGPFCRNLIYRFDRTTQSTTRISDPPANYPPSLDLSYDRALISGDGNVVVYEVLIAGAQTQFPFNDVYARDLVTNQISLVNRSTTGIPGDHIAFTSDINSDGSIVSFWSLSENIVTGLAPGVGYQSFLRFSNPPETALGSPGHLGSGVGGTRDNSISDDGRFVVYRELGVSPSSIPDDTNQLSDIYRFDRMTGQTIRVSVDPSGLGATEDAVDPVVSDDGSTVIFKSRFDYESGATLAHDQIFRARILEIPEIVY